MIESSDLFRRLVHSDIILPVQFFHSLCGVGIHKSGEQRLLIAILEDAIACFQKYAQPKNVRERRLFREAETWIMTGDVERTRAEHEGTPSSFSFEYVCAVLGLDVSYLRTGLRRWRSTVAGAGRVDEQAL